MKLKEESKKIEFNDGSVEYRLPNEDLHREDGPAIELLNGHKFWYLNNILYREKTDLGNEYWYNEEHEYHREDGPAVILSNGDQLWYKNNKIHREDGPAVIFNDGYEIWYNNGVIVSKTSKPPDIF